MGECTQEQTFSSQRETERRVLRPCRIGFWKSDQSPVYTVNNLVERVDSSKIIPDTNIGGRILPFMGSAGIIKFTLLYFICKGSIEKDSHFSAQAGIGPNDFLFVIGYCLKCQIAPDGI